MGTTAHWPRPAPPSSSLGRGKCLRLSGTHRSSISERSTETVPSGAFVVLSVLWYNSKQRDACACISLRGLLNTGHAQPHAHQATQFSVSSPHSTPDVPRTHLRSGRPAVCPTPEWLQHLSYCITVGRASRRPCRSSLLGCQGSEHLPLHEHVGDARTWCYFLQRRCFKFHIKAQIGLVTPSCQPLYPSILGPIPAMLVD